MNLQAALCKAINDQFDHKPSKLPLGSGVVWEAFAELSLARSSGANGPNPLSFSDIFAWSQLMNMPIQPHHTRAILAMDQVWMKRVYDRPELPEGTATLPARSTHKMTPAMFDLAMG